MKNFSITLLTSKKFNLSLLLIFIYIGVYSQTNIWNITGAGNWNRAANWSLGRVPLASDDVVIPNAATGLVSINIAAVCKSLRLEGGNKATSLKITGSNSLTVTNALTIEMGTLSGANRSFDVANGTLSVKDVVIAATGSANRTSSVIINKGVINVSNDFTMGDFNNYLTFTADGTLNIQGSIIDGVLNPGTGTVRFTNTKASEIKGSSNHDFYNLVIDKSNSTNTVTNSKYASSIGNTLKVTKGNFIITAEDADFLVKNEAIVEAAGNITHSVNWDETGKLLRVNGNFTIDGIFSYSVRSHVQLGGTGSNTVRTGSNPSSSFSILTIQNGDYYANGTVKVDDNFWAPFFTSGSFHTAGYNVSANAGIFITGGTFFVDGGSATISGGIYSGYAGSPGNLNVSSGQLTTDGLTVGDGTSASAGTVTHTGGTTDINGNISINGFSAYNCTNSPVINLKGNFANSGSFAAANSRINFVGSAAQSISGSSSSIFYNAELQNAAGLNLGANSGANNILTFTSGKINTAANKFTLSSSGSIAGANATSYINGNLEMGVQTGNPVKIFPIGDATRYTPVSLSFNNVTTSGAVLMSTKTPDHSNIGSSVLLSTKSVNRYFILSGSNFNYDNYDAVFNFLAADIDVGATTTKFAVGQYKSSAWAYPLATNKNSTNITANNVTGFGDFAIAETSVAVPSITSNPSNKSTCVNGSVQLSASFKSATTPYDIWQVSISGGAFTDITSGSQYSINTTLSGTTYTSVLTIDPVIAAMSSYRFRLSVTNVAGTSFTTNATLSLIAAPVVNINGGATSICNTGNTGSLAGVVSGGNATGGTWSDNAGGTFSPSATDLNAVYQPNVSFSGTATITLTATGGCLPTQATKTIAINSGPAFTVSAPVSDCQFTGIKSISTSTSTNSNSNTTTVNIPDYSATGAISTINLSGIPSNAVIQNIEVKLSVTHSQVKDLIVNLKAPNGNILNLIKQPNGGGANFTNTVISMLSNTLITSASAPYTGVFQENGSLNTNASSGYISNVNSFNALTSVPNGDWVLSFKDALILNSGKLTSWSITVTWTEPILWSPSTNLYIDPAATIPYNGGTNSTVYVKSDLAFSTLYNVTYFGESGCNSTKQVNVEINPKPELNIAVDYCYGGGKIELDANTDIPVTSYLWNTGETTETILVDLAMNFQAIVKTAKGCADTANANIGLELINNGNFEAGNTGFSSAYTYINKNTQNGLMPEKTYTVNDNPTFNHSNFWGRDHTTNTGNFMIINGNGSTPPVDVWSKTLTVVPNTDYYFSAWAISVNNVGPFADLQFKVNGVQVGTTTGALPSRPTNNNPPYGWVRFYGVWNSGAATTAVVSIVDLVTSPGGNDFGIDDISFGTLTPFINLTTTGKNLQTVCKDNLIENIVYSVGGMENGPIVTGLPDGVTGTYNNGIFTISGSPTTTGVFNFEVKSATNCISATKTGTITVQENTIVLLSAAGTDNQVKCIEPITPIKYQIGGKANGVTVTGLPAGVTGSLSGKTYTISGTPTASGSFNYTVTATGTCNSVSLSGTIKIESSAIALTSAPATSAQSVCVNTAITAVKYTISGNATGASVTGLPAGVNGVFSGSVLTISGTPTVSGTFSYSVSALGGCPSAILGGTITVNRQTIALSSALATANQTICLTTAITSIKYTVGGSATGATVTGLPAGVNSGFAAGVLTISGTPTATGTFNYTVTTTGTCAAASLSGSIKIIKESISLTSGASSVSQTICLNSPIVPISFAIEGTGATASGLPAGLYGSYSPGVYTISGSATQAGAFNIKVTTTGSCAHAEYNFSTTIAPSADGGTIPSISLCSAGSATLTLSGHTGNVVRWEYSTDSTTWINISNTTSTLNTTNPGSAIFYRALVNSGGCSSQYSNIARVGIHNLWTGKFSSEWNNPYNWSDAQLPNMSCDYVTIPATSNNPVLPTQTISIKNLIVYANATLYNNDATLKISGTITGAGKISADSSTIELNGNVAQSLSGAMFTGNTVYNLKVSNSGGLNIVSADTLKLQSELSFGASNAKIYVNNNLTLLSNARGTASVLDLTSGGLYTGNDILGRVTVERYIPKHPKAWQLLSIPTNGSTIQESWQEGNMPMQNNIPGRGIILTGNVANAVAKGFDISTPAGAGMKSYNPATNTWDGVPATTIPIANKRGYLVMIRGDRSVFTSTAPATEVTIRTMGQLYTTGANAPEITTVAAGKMESVGNPYACAVDFSKITKTGGIADMFYVWDPLLTNAGQSAYGLGGYQTFTRAGSSYEVTPGGGSYKDGNRMIESGQAIIVSAPYTGGTITFTESAKVSGSNIVNRPATNWQMIRSNIYVNSGGSRILVDGVMNQFDAFYSNNIDEYDAPKLSNTGENISLMRYSKRYSVESRNGIDYNDTIFYNMSGLKNITYELDIVPFYINEPDVRAYFHDKYLGTEVPVSLTIKTTIPFTISTAPGANAADRFYITFRPTSILPVTFTTISAVRLREKEVNVNWNVENEISMEKYEVERSLNGRDFIKIGETNPVGNSYYNLKDLNASPADNFYRIKGISIGGRVQYSAVAKVSGDNYISGISVMPNPVENKTMNIHFSGTLAGTYIVKITNNLGQVVYSSAIETNSANCVVSVDLKKLAAGTYQVSLNGIKKFSQRIIVR